MDERTTRGMMSERRVIAVFQCGHKREVYVPAKRDAAEAELAYISKNVICGDCFRAAGREFGANSDENIASAPERRNMDRIGA